MLDRTSPAVPSFCPSCAPVAPLRCPGVPPWLLAALANGGTLNANNMLRGAPLDRPPLLDIPVLEVAGRIRKAQLGQPRGPPGLPGDRLDPLASLASGQLPGGSPLPLDPGLLHQPPHCPPVRGKLGGDIGQQPLPPDEPIFQIRPHVDEAKLGHPRRDPLLGVAASLQRQRCIPCRSGSEGNCASRGTRCAGRAVPAVGRSRRRPQTRHEGPVVEAFPLVAELPILWSYRGVRAAANPVTSRNAHDVAGWASQHLCSARLLPAETPGAVTCPPVLAGDPSSMGNNASPAASSHPGVRLLDDSRPLVQRGARPSRTGTANRRRGAVAADPAGAGRAARRWFTRATARSAQGCAAHQVHVSGKRAVDVARSHGSPSELQHLPAA